MIGSANATTAALGRNLHDAINEEFCVMLRSDTHNFLKDIGLDREKVKVSWDDIAKMKRQPNNSIEVKCHMSKLNRIISAELLNHRLTLQVDVKTKDKDIDIWGTDNFGETFNLGRTSLDEKITLDIGNTHEQLAFCEIRSKAENSISNKQYINYVERLNSTNPSKANRTMARVLMNINNDNCSLSDILDFVQELLNESNTVNDKPKTTYRPYLKKDDDDIETTNYDTDYDPDADNEETAMKLRTNNMATLLSAIEEAIRRKMQNISENKAEEEEEGKPTESYQQDDKPQDKKREPYNELAKAIKKMASSFSEIVYNQGIQRPIADINNFYHYNTILVLATRVYCSELFDSDDEIDFSLIEQLHKDFIKTGHALIQNLTWYCLHCIPNTTEERLPMEIAMTISRTLIALNLIKTFETENDSNHYYKTEKLCILNLFHLYGQYYDFDEQNDFISTNLSHISRKITAKSIKQYTEDILKESSKYKWYDGYGFKIKDRYLEFYRM